MTAPAAENHFFFRPTFSWRKHVVQIMLYVFLTDVGMALGEVAGQIASATESIFPACLLGLLAVGIVFVGLISLFYLAQITIIHTRCRKMTAVWMRPSHIWVYYEICPFPKAYVIAYPDICWLSREFTPCGKRCLRIVHGPGCDTTYVADLPLNPDIELLHDLLAARCPGALAPEPPVGYHPPQYPERRLPPNRAAASRRTAGRRTYETVLLACGWVACATAAVIASLMGSLGPSGVCCGCFVLFCGLSCLIVIRAVVRPDQEII